MSPWVNNGWLYIKCPEYGELCGHPECPICNPTRREKRERQREDELAQKVKAKASREG